MKDKVWFITGCSSGFGKELAIKALQQGYKVAAAARNVKDVEAILSESNGKAIAVQLDMTKTDEIKSAIETVVSKFGRIDVLVNNAGIGYFGAIEESEEDEVRRMFEINVFGLARLTQKVLPVMRKQKNGHILNVSSIGGIIGYPAVGFYNATKFAVNGLSESLAKETGPLGIKVTIICPSGFRTDWAGRSANESPVVISDYEETAGTGRKNIRGNSGKQAGDPVRAAEAIIKAVESEEPPLYLMLGEAAYKNGTKKLTDQIAEMDKWKITSIGADFPK